MESVPRERVSGHIPYPIDCLPFIHSSGVRKKDAPVVTMTVCNTADWNMALVLLHSSSVTSRSTHSQTDRTLGCSNSTLLYLTFKYPAARIQLQW